MVQYLVKVQKHKDGLLQVMNDGQHEKYKAERIHADKNLNFHHKQYLHTFKFNLNLEKKN